MAVASFSSSASARLAARRAFSKRGIQQERTTVHERMIRRFEGLARPARLGGARDQVLIHLQIALKIQSVTRGPPLLTRHCRQKLPPEGADLASRLELGFRARIARLLPRRCLERPGARRQ